MSTKLIIFVAALIAVGPALAAGTSSGGGSSGGSSSVSAGSGGGGHSGGGGGGGGGGGHSGGGGGGGHGAGGGLGGHAAAASARGAALASHGTTLANHGATRVGPVNAAHAISSKHAAGEHPASRLAGTEHHHHHHNPLRREPQSFGDTGLQFNGLCDTVPWSQTWWNCNGPAKSRAGSKQRS
jgi:hypothetical protein